jgi:hypothetical protein
LQLKLYHYTDHTQKNGAVSKVDKKFVSHSTWAQHTLSAAGTVQVSHPLPSVRFSCLLQGLLTSFQYGIAAGEGFLCAPFEVSRSVTTVQCEFRARFKEDIILVWCVFFKPYRFVTMV